MFTFELKPIAKEAIPQALEKAHRYRLLSEPGEAESICRDVLRVDPENQQALITLLLALTDQFERGLQQGAALEILPRLKTEYDRAYYAGLIAERRAKAQLRQRRPAAGQMAYEGLREAMQWFEKAEALRPAGNEDAILRWNACARRLMNNPELRPADRDISEPPLE